MEHQAYIRRAEEILGEARAKINLLRDKAEDLKADKRSELLVEIQRLKDKMERAERSLVGYRESGGEESEDELEVSLKDLTKTVDEAREHYLNVTPVTPPAGK